MPGDALSGHIGFEDGEVLDHCILTHLNVDAASIDSSSICDGPGPVTLAEIRRVVHHKTAAPNKDGTAAIAAGIEDGFFEI